MKKQIFRGIVVLLSLAFMALPALSAVSIAPNDKGDLLIYPMFYAMEGIETNIEVINTSATKCAVAKVIVRSHKYSFELLDFLIYLTPNDVFRATLKFDGGKYVLVSTDDSLCLTSGSIISAQASEDDPLALELYPPTVVCACATADSPDWGYIDVIEVTSYDKPTNICTTNNVASDCCVQSDHTINKAALVKMYANDAGAMNPANILTGHAALVFPGAEYALFKPTILRNYKNSSKLQVADPDPTFENIDDLEAALSKNNLVIPYFNKSDAFTIAWLNFPTKQTICAEDKDCKGWTTASCFFNHIAKMAPLYGADIYDLQEHPYLITGCTRSPCGKKTRLTDELNLIFDWLNSGNPYTEGWARLELESTLDNAPKAVCAVDSCEAVYYTDPPVIGLVGEITPEGLSLMSPAYDFGAIIYDDATTTGASYNGDFQLGCISCGN